MEVQLLSNGYFALDKTFLVYSKYQGETYEAALKPLLVLSEGERILIDTGIGELFPQYRRFHTVKRNPDQSLRMQLQNFRLKPEDITIVINTHLHFDHCGNNELFKNARFMFKLMRYDMSMLQTVFRKPHIFENFLMLM